MKAIGWLVSALLGFGIWFALFRGPNDLLRFEGADGPPPLSWWIILVAGYLVLLAGAFLGVACRHLIERRKAGQETVRIGPFLKASLRQTDLWIAFLGSPLIYGSILRSGADLSPGAFFYFALQSGFSAYVVLTSLIGSVNPPDAVSTTTATR